MAPPVGISPHRHLSCFHQQKNGIQWRSATVGTHQQTGQLSAASPSLTPGRAMARTGLRMMPTFPSLPLEFRKSSFPRYGFKAGISGRAFPAERRLRLGRFASALLAHRVPRLCPALCRGTQLAAIFWQALVLITRRFSFNVRGFTPRIFWPIVQPGCTTLARCRRRNPARG